MTTSRATRRLLVRAAALVIKVVSLGAVGAALPGLSAVAASGATATPLAKSADPIRSTRLGYAGTFLGKIQGTDIAVAVVVAEDRSVVAYVCDAQGVSQWFRGTATRDHVRLEANGHALELTLGRTKAVGRLTGTDGAARSFTATGSKAGSGLWRAAGSIGGADLVAGWIVIDGKLNGLGFGFGGGSCGFNSVPPFGFSTGFGGFGGCAPCFNCNFGNAGFNNFGAVNGAPAMTDGTPLPVALVTNRTLAVRLVVGGETGTLTGTPVGSRTVASIGDGTSNVH